MSTLRSWQAKTIDALPEGILIVDADIRLEPPDTPNAVALDDDGVVDRGWTS